MIIRTNTNLEAISLWTNNGNIQDLLIGYSFLFAPIVAYPQSKIYLISEVTPEYMKEISLASSSLITKFSSMDEDDFNDFKSETLLKYNKIVVDDVASGDYKHWRADKRGGYDLFSIVLKLIRKMEPQKFEPLLENAGKSARNEIQDLYDYNNLPYSKSGNLIIVSESNVNKCLKKEYLFMCRLMKD